MFSKVLMILFIGVEAWGTGSFIFGEWGWGRVHPVWAGPV